MLIFICYIEVNVMFALLDCVRYNEDFVKSRFCSIHFTVILAGPKKIVCYIEDFIIAAERPQGASSNIIRI